MALYADDARAVWPGEGAEAQGKPEIEKLIVETLKGFPVAKMSLESQDALPLGRGYIAVIGRWRMVVPAQAGNRDATDSHDRDPQEARRAHPLRRRPRLRRPSSPAGRRDEAAEPAMTARAQRVQ